MERQQQQQQRQQARMQRRRCISNAQRRALRAWFFDASDPQPAGAVPCEKTYADASAWWKESYGYYLNSSTVSEILSPRYAMLDQPRKGDGHAGKSGDGRKRERRAKWEDLEEELYKWVLEYEAATGCAGVSGSLLRDKATELWYHIPCYSGQPCPNWSEGWKARFRARYNIKKCKRSGPQSGAGQWFHNNKIIINNNIFISSHSQSNNDNSSHGSISGSIGSSSNDNSSHGSVGGSIGNSTSSSAAAVIHGQGHGASSDGLSALDRLDLEEYSEDLSWLDEPSWSGMAGFHTDHSFAVMTDMGDVSYQTSGASSFPYMTSPIESEWSSYQ